jgi:uncharacterized membrane protein
VKFIVHKLSKSVPLWHLVRSCACSQRWYRWHSLWAAGFACCLILFASAVFAFPITDFTIRIEVSRDSSIHVTETITADFTNEPHHGIYREIPLSGKDYWGNKYRLRIEEVRVTDRSGRPLPTFERFRDGNIYLRIGDPEVYVSGQQTYVISYRVWRAVHFFSEHDELYWNAIGTEGEVPILKAFCVVVLPDDVRSNQIRVACYTGQYGSAGSAKASWQVIDPAAVRFWTTETLSPGEGMTVVVGWPKGIVLRPSLARECLWFASDNGYVFLVPLFSLGLFVYWKRVGADADTGRSLVVTYEPPYNLSPAELGTLIDERVDIRDISASIVDLAVRGYLRIKETVEKGFLRTNRDYTLELTKPFEEVVKDPALKPFEVALIMALFAQKQFCVISSLEYEFYVHIPKLKTMLYNSLVKQRYFTHSPESVRKTYLGAGIGILGAGIFLVFLGLGDSSGIVSTGWGISVALCGAILAVASRTMPRKTAKGKNALLAARGFEEYLSRAERALIEHQERQNYFEKFLPYAMVFGIAHRWAKAFDGIQTEPPHWYTGEGAEFHPVYFAHRLNRAASGWASTFTSQPRSSGSSGGGGFFSGRSGFGGGFSGGGGGGGGVGGW